MYRKKFCGFSRKRCIFPFLEVGSFNNGIGLSFSFWFKLLSIIFHGDCCSLQKLIKQSILSCELFGCKFSSEFCNFLCRCQKVISEICASLS